MNKLMSIGKIALVWFACLMMPPNLGVCGSMVELTGVHIEVYVSDPIKKPPTVIAQGWAEAKIVAVEGSSSTLSMKCDMYDQLNLGDQTCGDRGGFVTYCAQSFNLQPSDVGKVVKCPVATFGSCNRQYYTKGRITVMDGPGPAFSQSAWSGCASAGCGINTQ